MYFHITFSDISLLNKQCRTATSRLRRTSWVVKAPVLPQYFTRKNNILSVGRVETQRACTYLCKCTVSIWTMIYHILQVVVHLVACTYEFLAVLPSRAPARSVYGCNYNENMSCHCTDASDILGDSEGRRTNHI